MIWSSSNTRCERDCSYEADPNAIRVNSANWTACDCKKDYYWDAISSTCKVTATANLCGCPDGLVWSSTYLSCIRNCSLDPNAVGLCMENKQQCLCKITLFKTYVWSTTYKKCVPYCPFGF